MRLRKLLVATIIAVALATGGAQATGDRHRVGATCNDGTASSATGSGACSHHHGVKCWQYSDGTCTEA
jgi:hypothetical protein